MTNLRIPAWMRMCGVFAVLVACVGCSSTGRFGTGDSERDYKAITTYEVEFPSTGNADMDRVGSGVVMAIEDKKPELDIVIAKLWSERELNYLVDGAKEQVKAKHGGITWADASPEQQRSALSAVYASMSIDEQRKIDQWKEAEGPAVAAAKDDAGEIVIIILKGLETAESLYNQLAGADIGGLIAFGYNEGRAIWGGVEQIQEMDQWANGVNLFIGDYTEAMDSWDEILRYNRDKAHE